MALLPQDPQKQKLLLLGLVPIVLAFLYYNFYHTPRVTQLETDETALETLQNANDGARAVVAQYGPRLRQRLDLLEAHVAQIETLLPRREDVPELINLITSRAQMMGVELAALNPAPEQAGQFYSRQSYDLQVLGGYHAIAEYLTAIGSMPRIVRSSELKLSVDAPNVGPRGEPRLRALFRIETYVMPESVALPEPAAAPAGGI